MNHLAHLFLAQSDINLLVGNYIADHVKGKQIEEFSSEIQRGIQMHRGIDEFTDKHPVVIECKERLYPKYHKYASVLIDMFFDHVLAKNWQKYSPISLASFTKSAYQMLGTKQNIYPNSVKLMYDHMSKYDWLNSYASINGMGKALNGLANRASFESKMEESIVDLKQDFSFYESNFEAFFPELIEYANTWTKAYE